MAGLWDVDYSGYTPSELQKLDPVLGAGSTIAAQQAADRQAAAVRQLEGLGATQAYAIDKATQEQTAMMQQPGGAGERPNGVPSTIERPQDLDPGRPWAGMNLAAMSPDQINSMSTLSADEKTQMLNEREQMLADHSKIPVPNIATDKEAAAQGQDVDGKQIPGAPNPYAAPAAPPVAGAKPVGFGGGTGQLGALAAQAGKIDDKANAAINSATGAIGDSMKREADINEGLAQEQAKAQAQAQGILVAQNKAAQIHDMDQRIAKARREQTMMREMNKFEDLKASVASMKEDPDRFYKSEDGSTNYGKKIAGALAMALGQLGAALSGGQNAAMQLIEGAIDRDIESQRANISKARGDLADQKGFLADLRQKGFDEEGAAAAMKSAMLEDYKRQIDTTLASTNDEAIIAKAQAEKERVTQRQGELQIKAAESVANNEARSVQMQSGIEANRQQIGLQREQIGAQRAAAGAKGAADGREIAASGLVPRGGATPDEAAFRKAQTMKGNTDALRKQIDQLSSINEDSWTSVDPAKRAAGDTAVKNAIVSYNKAKEMGALDKGTIELGEALFGGNPASAFGTRSRREKYKQLLTSINQDLRSNLNAMGFDEAQQYTPTGGKKVE